MRTKLLLGCTAVLFFTLSCVAGHTQGKVGGLTLTHSCSSGIPTTTER
jgi:hypothetical protein